PRVASHAPQTCASTSSATSAWVGKLKTNNIADAVQACAPEGYFCWAGLALDSGLAVVVAGALPAGAVAPPSVCVGADGEAPVCGADCCAGEAAGDGLAFAPPSIKERWPPTPMPSSNAMSMKTAAAPMVILARMLCVPRGPKAVLEIELVKSAPASALPGCKRIETM